ncbi:hypothetical protein KDD17_16885 [Sulfitobacter albidus]|uniref:DnaA N-terminal domain-containing protein n=2 Tax=Sulfitobacter albidus TaxID=2829501 RepID=A0A975JH96_9RHOB|nr:hypothetical protein KDD17_16885 [Sulfitobacter albidus]
MRLCSAITARYNWRIEELSIGHTELAQLWAVNPRTVKREMRRLQDMGILVCIRAGVRGRVGAYRLNHARIAEFTRPCWQAIGADFEDRMSSLAGERTVVRVDFSPAPDPKPMDPGGTWGAVRRRLQAEHGGIFDSWFAKLVQDPLQGDTLVLRAPNSFVCRYIETHFSALLSAAVTAEMPTADGRARPIKLVC